MRSREEEESLGVIVTTFRRPDNLARCLTHLANQTRLPNKVCVIGVRDEVETLRASIKIKGLDIVWLRSDIPNQRVQRDLGIQTLLPRCKWIMFLDDDVELSPSYIASLFEVLHHQGTAKAGIAGKIISEQVPNRKSPPPRPTFPLHPRKMKYFRNLTAYGRPLPLPSTGSPLKVDWLPTPGSMWHHSVLKTIRHKPLFSSYQMYEDVIFSREASRYVPLVYSPSAIAVEALAQTEKNPRVRYDKMRSYAFHSAWYVTGEGGSIRSLHLAWIGALAIQRLWWAARHRDFIHIIEAAGLINSLPIIAAYALVFRKNSSTDWILRKAK